LTHILHGVIRGKTIELEVDAGMPEGQKVEVAIRTVPTQSETELGGEGLRRCAGSLAGIPGLEEDMAAILRERKTARFRGDAE
jgi:hypothetical protein